MRLKDFSKNQIPLHRRAQGIMSPSTTEGSAAGGGSADVEEQRESTSPTSSGTTTDKPREDNQDALGTATSKTNGTPADHPQAGPGKQQENTVPTNNGISSRKVAANRRNAQQSTGPKSPAGKRRSSKNAITHGIFLSKASIIDAGDGKEDSQEFAAVHEGLRIYYAPDGMEEEMLVEELAVCRWRRRKALNCETGGIRKQLDNVLWQDSCDRQDEFEMNLAQLPYIEARRYLKRSSQGLAYFISTLEDITVEVQYGGRLTEKDAKRLAQTFGTDEQSVTRICLIYESSASGAREDRGPHSSENLLGDLKPEECRKQIVKRLREEISRLNAMLKGVKRVEKLQLEAKMGAYSLPPENECLRLMRYETGIRRLESRARKELDQVQQRRRSEQSAARRKNHDG